MESSISKLVMKLVRNHDQEERETDGAVHWKSMGPKLRYAFRQEADTPPLMSTGLINSTQEAVTSGSIARTPTTFYCMFAPFKGTLVGT